MELKDKVVKWLDNLKLFSLNAEVHCSREEKALNLEFTGTREVNIAFNEMIKHMHQDLGFEYEGAITESTLIKGGRQILIFEIGERGYYTDITALHEVMTYPSRQYNQVSLKEEWPMIGILNWYEGLVPVIETHGLLGEPKSENKYLLIYDIGKEIFAFTVTKVYPKHEIKSSVFGQDICLDGREFKYANLERFEKHLIDMRLKIKF